MRNSERACWMAAVAALLALVLSAEHGAAERLEAAMVSSWNSQARVLTVQPTSPDMTLCVYGECHTAQAWLQAAAENGGGNGNDKGTGGGAAAAGGGRAR